MKNTFSKSILFACFIASMLISGRSYASHLIGAELRYRWVTGNSYEITVVLYGDCSSTSGAFGTLPASTPQVCIYNGSTYQTSIYLPVQIPDSGILVSPVCPDSSAFTTCTSLSYDIPGIKKFVYTNTVTLPHTSQTWQFIYEGNNPGGSAAGRTSAITNLFNPGGTITGLIDTLNNSTTRGHNSSPLIATDPAGLFCGFTEQCYLPAAVDIYDTSTLYAEPLGDSLFFSLVVPLNGTGEGCSPTSTYCTYVPALNAWTTPYVQAIDGAHPIQCESDTGYSFNTSTGELCFDPIEPQRSTVTYNIEEYFHDTLTGTMQREMNFLIEACTLPCLTLNAPVIKHPQPKITIYPNPANMILTISSSAKITEVTFIDVTGKKALSHIFNSKSVEVNVCDMPPGMYMVKVNGVEAGKFVKN